MSLVSESSASHLLALLLITATSVTAQSSVSEPAPATTTVECLRFQKTGFWDIDIDNRPALPRECGPPFSFNSDRDLNHLPYQIVAICGSYIACVVGVGLAILTIRRKRKTLVAIEPVELKLVNNESKKFEPVQTPASPATSFASWMRNPLRKKAASGATFGNGQNQYGDLNSPGMASMMSFDESVIDQDRESRQAEMDRLYAAVMVHDAAKRSQAAPASRPEATRALSSSTIPRASNASDGGPRPADRRLQRVAHLDVRPPQSPVRAIYPPSHDNTQTPLSPTSPVHATVPDEFWSQQPRQQQTIRNQLTVPMQNTGPLSPGMPLSPTTPRVELPNDMYPASPPPGERRMRLANHAGQTFPLSPGGLMTPISPAPMSAAMFASMGPASPRYPLPNDMYPASPPLQSNPMTFPAPQAPFADAIRRPASTRSFGSRMETESVTSKSSKGRRMMKNMRINTGARDDDLDAEDRAPLSSNFQKNPDLQPANNSSDSATPDTPTSTELEDRFENLNTVVPSQSQTRLGTPPRRPTLLNLQAGPHSRKPSLTSINTNIGTGPVGLPSSPAPSHRSIGLPSGPRPTAPTSAPSIASPPMRSPASNASATAPGGSKPLALRVQFGDNGLLSPAPVKTTFLERKKEALSRGTAKTPRTGMMPQTPYSAYMPFTPVTPVTPHLVSRQERKQRKKELGKGLMQDSDLVKEDDEEWD